MTTRYSSSPPGAVENRWFSNAVGQDGKYETVDGTRRIKWNDYVLTTWKSNRTKGLMTDSRFPGSSQELWTSGTCFPASPLEPSDHLTLISRLSEAVKGHEFNLAVSAAEGKKTVNMVVDSIRSISSAIRDLKRGNVHRAASRFRVSPSTRVLSTKGVSGRWLELQYGWLPMISDVYNAAKAYEALTNGPRVNRIQTSIGRSNIGNSSCAPSLYSVKGYSKARRTIIYEMSEQLSAPRSLGLTDPLQVVWELIPYSFVVDWFIPIGTYLDSLNVVPHLKGRFLTTETHAFQGSAEYLPPPLWYQVLEKAPTESVNYFYMKREVSSSLSVPKPRFVPLDKALSPKRILNAIALAVQLHR